MLCFKLEFRNECIVRLSFRVVVRLKLVEFENVRDRDERHRVFHSHPKNESLRQRPEASKISAGDHSLENSY